VNVGPAITVPTQPVAAGSPTTITTAVSNAGPGTHVRSPRSSISGRLDRAGRAGADVDPDVERGPNVPDHVDGDTDGGTTPIATVGLPRTPPIPRGRQYGPRVDSPATLSSPRRYRVHLDHRSTQAYFGQAGTQVRDRGRGADIFQKAPRASDDYGADLPNRRGHRQPPRPCTRRPAEHRRLGQAGLVMRNDLTKNHVSPRLR